MLVASTMVGEAGRGTRRDWVLIALAMLITAIPLLGPQIPPLADLPGHMGRWAIQIGRDDPFLAAHFAFQKQLIGNLGFDLLVPPLGRIIGLEPAVKLLTIVTAAGLAGAMLWAAKEAHGRVPPAAGFALPFVFAYPFQFGFVNYCLSLALAFAGLALWLRMDAHRWKPAIFAVYGCLTWLAHTMGWGVLCILIFAAELARLREAGVSRGATLGRAIVSALPLGLPVLAMIVVASSARQPVPTYFIGFGNKVVWLIMALSDRSRGFDIASVGIALGLIALALMPKPLRLNRTLGFAAALLFLVFLALPFMLLGSAYADMRLAPPMIATALLAISARGRWAMALTVAGLAFFAVRTGATVRSFALHEATIQRELTALDAIPRNARVLAFVGQPCRGVWMLSRTTHIASMAIVRRHAFTNDQFAGEGAQLVRVRYRAAGAFSRDPSQMVVGGDCPRSNWKRFAPALAAAPRDAFDFVWLIAPPIDRAADLSGLTPVWRNGSSALYRIVRTAPPPATPRTASEPARSDAVPPRTAR